MRLLKLSIITATVLVLAVAHAADKKESRKAHKEKSAQSATPAVNEAKVHLVISGMT
ncbi:MAG: hypothetical protein HY735_31995 [Verrucomicrobia bacterium]|nr:hypothetical protein [Verrucomicrobiota bacterium]